MQSLRTRLLSPLAAAVLCFLGHAVLAQDAAPRLRAAFGDAGLTGLAWDGDDILQSGVPQVSRVILESRRLNDEGIFEYEFETVTADPRGVRFDADARRRVQEYPWGSASFDYEVGEASLTTTITLRNDSDRTLAMFDITAFSLALPEAADIPKHWHRIAVMPGDFNAVDVTFGDSRILVGGKPVLPLRMGFGKPRAKKTVLPVVIQGNVKILEPGGVVYHHYGLPRIPAGESLAVSLSLRLAPKKADVDALRADLVEAFRAYHKPRLAWRDRRPIGAIFIGKGRGPANNPRNWFGDAKLDVRTEEGRAELHKRMMQHADRCIKVLKNTNAQGMVLWDPEGAENPHPTTYIGDPRMVKLVAPEMADIYPDYFRKFAEAGLRTGICIRPTQVYMTPFTAACDGDAGTRWSVQQFPQWIEVDFGRERAIDRTEVVCLNDRAYQYRIEAKSDGGEYRQIVDRTENTTPGTAEAPITDRFEPVKARFVRLTVTGAAKYEGDWCSLREFRVYAGESDNLCLNRASDASRRFGRTVGGHGTGAFNPKQNPLDDDFSAIWPEGVPAERFYPIVERMSRKIEFAKEKWGCTLFYVDTNGVHRPVGEEQKRKWTLLDPHIWREIHKRHPDVLLIPEFARNPGQLAYTTTYLQPPYSSAVLKPLWRKLLPGAFGVSYTVNLSRDRWQELRPTLVRGVAEGDSLFFRGWFGCAYNKLIRDLYDEVYEPDAINPGLPDEY